MSAAARWSLGAGLVVLLSSSAAFAQQSGAEEEPVVTERAPGAEEPTEADPPPPTEAEQRFAAGVEHLRNEAYEDAAAAFRESYRLDPNVTTMCNLALTYDRWGDEHHPRAVSAYRTCARDDDSEQYRAYAERRVGEIERELALLEDHGTEPEPDPIVPAATGDEVAPGPSDGPAERDRALLFSGLGVGGLGLGTLIAAAVLATDASNTVEALRMETGGTIERGSPEHDRLLLAQSSANAAVGLYVATGFVLATAAALIVADLVLDSQGPTVAVAPSPEGVLVTLRAPL